MKRFTRFFLAVAIAFAGIACTTDATEDLGVKPEGQTTLSISLEESRTQLGAKADGVYPLLWSEGDAIAVNGVASAALTASQAGTAGALFTFAEVLARPYNIVYPAPAEGVTALTEGQYPVVFPAAQAYTAGTFASGTAPMYGYAAADSEGAIQLNHLTGIICLAIKGEGTVLKSLTVSTESGAIAGTFDVDCATGTLTPHEDASNSVVMTFGDGLALKADEATPIYVAVPAGQYSTFSLTLSTATDKMTVKFDSNGEKAIKAGTVREFAEFAYVANSHDSEEFLIESKEDLIRFAEIAPTFYPHKVAKVVANIDMTGVEWSPIVGFGPYTFDGGNFEIKGLSAPLFEETSAAIENVKLVDVNIVETAKANVGAIAREMPIVSGVTALTNCSASGTIVVNCENVGSLDYVCGIGGILGSCEKGMLISNCTNNVNIDIKGITTQEATAKNFYIGGVAGYNKSVISDSTNKGSVSIGTISTTGDLMIGGVWGSGLYAIDSTNEGAITLSGTYNGRVFVGGAVGYTMATGEAKNSGCSNSGTIETTKDAVFNKATYIGGMAGCTKFSTENCTNSGDITINGTFNNLTYLAGNTGWIFATLKTNLVTGANNSGNITIGGNAVFAKVGGDLPGSYATALSDYLSRVNPFIAGCTATGNTALSDSNNSGNITISKDAQLSGGYLIGGVVANTSKRVDNCENSGNIEFAVGSIIKNNGFISGGIVYVSDQGIGNITNRGAISFHGTTTHRLFIGGCLAQSCLAATTEGSEIIADLKNYGAITLDGEMTTANASTNVGGVICYSKGNAARLYNYSSATITVAHQESSSNYNVAGLIVDIDSHLTDAHNYAAINVSGKTAGDTNSAFVGGLVAHHASVANRTNCSNSGAITFSTTSTPTSISVGGVFVSGVRLNCKNCHNTGSITVKEFGLYAGNENSNLTCGGLFGRIMDAKEHVTLSNCTNSGAINVDGSDCGGAVYVGGLFANLSSTATTLQIVGDSENNIGVVNSGDITVKGCGKTLNSANSWLAVGGILAQTNKAFVASGKEWSGIIKNTGAISVTTQQDQGTYVGGIAGIINNTDTAATLTGGTIVTTGDVTCSGVVPTNYQIGGVVGHTKTNIIGVLTHCNIRAIGFSNVGMITGSLRSATIVASNCKVGGTICTNSSIGEAEDGSGDEVVVDEIITLNNSNFYNYIYGDAIDWTNIENYDGCTFLSEVPTI